MTTLSREMMLTDGQRQPYEEDGFVFEGRLTPGQAETVKERVTAVLDESMAIPSRCRWAGRLFPGRYLV